MESLFDATRQRPARQFIALLFAIVAGTSCGRGDGDAVVVPAARVLASPTLDAHVVLTNQPTVSIEGSAPGAAEVEVSVFGGTSVVSVADGRFYADVALHPDAVNTLYFTSLATDHSRSAPTTTSVTMDGQPPSLNVQFPLVGAVVSGSTTSVSGTVGDMLSGFMGLQVQVAGIPATVHSGIGTNGSFEAAGVPVAAGGFTEIVIRAEDAVGNYRERTIQVSRAPERAGTERMHVLEGDGQIGIVHAELATPIAVQVLRGDGSPFAGKLVRMRVVRGDGSLRGPDESSGDLELLAPADGAGVARAFWSLGGAAGPGNNRVEITSNGIAGALHVSATATPRPGTQINVGSGNNQIGETGQLLPAALTAWVSDGCNGVAGVAVTFSVVGGSATIEGETSKTVRTTSTGHASVGLRLGAVGGACAIEADFDGNQTAPARFVATGLERLAGQPTRLGGLVLDNTGQPIEGATCTLVVGNRAARVVLTDVNGRFEYADAGGAGPCDLFVDGLTAHAVGGRPVPTGSFPSLHYAPVLVPSARNALPMPALLPRLDPVNAREYSTTHDVELTIAGVEGLRMIVPAGSMLLPDGSPAPEGTTIALNQVHHDEVPMPLPDGARPALAWTLQPAGARFDPPIRMEYPNFAGLAPGAIGYFLSFDHATNRFEIVASGTVTADGSTLVTDPGSGLTIAGWGGSCPPYPGTGRTEGDLDGDEDDEGDVECMQACVSRGELTGGVAEVDLGVAVVGELVTFQAYGVVDSGGVRTRCVNGQPEIVDIPAGVPAYRWEIRRDGAAFSSGAGNVATLAALMPGEYACQFTVTAPRTCAPTPRELPVRTAKFVLIDIEVAQATIPPGTGSNPGTTPVVITVTGPVVPLLVTTDVEIGSGGHSHETPEAKRPAAQLRNESGSLVSEFSFESEGVSTVFKPSTGGGGGIAGLYRVQVKSAGRVLSESAITVRYFLSELQPSPLYHLRSVDPYHLDSLTNAPGEYHWGTAAANSAIQKAAQEFLESYGQNFPSPRLLVVNDQSLMWGGLFEAADDDWLPPHATHRDGNRADISFKYFDANATPQEQSAPPGSEAWFAILAALESAFPNVCVEADHFHCNVVPSAGCPDSGAGGS